MSTKPSHKRLAKEYKNLVENPIPLILARPLENNLLEWHFVVTGPSETPYEGGQYHGRLKFLPEYPFKPPAIYMYTPSGRFNTNTSLCFSMSEFHPETWNPAWSVSTILNAFLSFMVTEDTTSGSITDSLENRKQYCKQSFAFNLKNSKFNSVFPDLVKENRNRVLATNSEKPSEENIQSPSILPPFNISSSFTKVFLLVVVVGFVMAIFQPSYV